MARRASRPGTTGPDRDIVPKSSASSGLSAWQPIQKEVRPTGDDVGPDLAVTRDRLRGGTTLTFRGGAMTLGERLRSQPSLEGLFVAPPGDHQPLITVVGRLQQFVTLESVRIVNGSGACGESVGQLVTGVRVLPHMSFSVRPDVSLGELSPYSF